MNFDVAAVRREFAALAAPDAPVHADAPGGTQVPERVIAAIGDYLRRDNANAHGAFATSRATDRMVAEGRRRAAMLMGTGDPDAIVFGANMTSLTFAISRALSREWEEGDEVVVTRLDHDGNVAPWRRAAADRGCRVREVPFTAEGGLRVDDLAAVLGPRTRLVAFTLASNALGTVVDAAPLVAAARAAGAVVYLDAVHAAPHRLLDVPALGADFAVCSAYKFCGPHLGLCYGRPELLARLPAYKVRPAPDTAPDRWETGTPSFEAIAGFAAQIDYLASLVDGERDAPASRERLVESYAALRAQETDLARRFLAGCRDLPGVRVHGIDDPAAADRRTPTFGLSVAGRRPEDLARRLAEAGVYAWAGHFYAIGITADLGLDEAGGLLRIGFAHYHDRSDVDRVLEALAAVLG